MYVCKHHHVLILDFSPLTVQEVLLFCYSVDLPVQPDWIFGRPYLSWDFVNDCEPSDSVSVQRYRPVCRISTPRQRKGASTMYMISLCVAELGVTGGASGRRAGAPDHTGPAALPAGTSTSAVLVQQYLLQFVCVTQPGQAAALTCRVCSCSGNGRQVRHGAAAH